MGGTLGSDQRKTRATTRGHIGMHGSGSWRYGASGCNGLRLLVVRKTAAALHCVGILSDGDGCVLGPCRAAADTKRILNEHDVDIELVDIELQAVSPRHPQRSRDMADRCRRRRNRRVPEFSLGIGADRVADTRNLASAMCTIVFRSENQLEAGFRQRRREPDVGVAPPKASRTASGKENSATLPTGDQTRLPGCNLAITAP